MKLYRTPRGYQTIIEKLLFEGACEECRGEGCYLHPCAGRVPCLQCDGWGSEKRKIEGIARREANRKKELKMNLLTLLYFVVIPVAVFLLSRII